VRDQRSEMRDARADIRDARDSTRDHLHHARDPRDGRDVRDVRDARDPRDVRAGARDPREPARDARDARDPRDARDTRETRDGRGDTRDRMGASEGQYDLPRVNSSSSIRGRSPGPLVPTSAPSKYRNSSLSPARQGRARSRTPPPATRTFSRAASPRRSPIARQNASSGSIRAASPVRRVVSRSRSRERARSRSPPGGAHRHASAWTAGGDRAATSQARRTSHADEKDTEFEIAFKLFSQFMKLPSKPRNAGDAMVRCCFSFLLVLFLRI
jgi:hypothetical protein